MQKFFLITIISLTASLSINAFWPPDMVPHPMPPEQEEKEEPNYV